MKMIVSLAQMDVVLGQPEVNLEKAHDLAFEARRRGADLVVFPELWLSSYDLANAARYVSSDEAPFAAMVELARQNRIYVTGSLLTRSTRGYLNTAPLVSPAGEVLGTYSKTHLFPPIEEDKYLIPGDDMPLFDTPWGPTALALCYDLRFPELFRHYALAGAQIILIPAQWPYPRLEHWRTLLRARAIENQLFVAACNRVGRENQLHYFGRSAICDPWGETVIEAGETEVLLTAEVDLQRVHAIREEIPVFQNRRGDLY